MKTKKEIIEEILKMDFKDILNISENLNRIIISTCESRIKEVKNKIIKLK